MRETFEASTPSFSGSTHSTFGEKRHLLVEYGVWIANAYDLESTDHLEKSTDHLRNDVVSARQKQQARRNTAYEVAMSSSNLHAQIGPKTRLLENRNCETRRSTKETMQETIVKEHRYDLGMISNEPWKLRK